jgi:hypothetical protein
VKGTSLLTLYVAIIGLGTLAGILFNVIINKRVIYKVIGIIITLVTGTFACCVVLFPYNFFDSYTNLIIKLSLSAVLLIVIYISARMIVNAVSTIRGGKDTETAKDKRKTEPVIEEAGVASFALKNRVKDMITADKEVKNPAQRVSVNFNNYSPKNASGKEAKEEPQSAHGTAQSDAGQTFKQILKDADDRALSESKAFAESSGPAVTGKPADSGLKAVGSHGGVKTEQGILYGQPERKDGAEAGAAEPAGIVEPKAAGSVPEKQAEEAFEMKIAEARLETPEVKALEALIDMYVKDSSSGTHSFVEYEDEEQDAAVAEEAVKEETPEVVAEGKAVDIAVAGEEAVKEETPEVVAEGKAGDIAVAAEEAVKEETPEVVAEDSAVEIAVAGEEVVKEEEPEAAAEGNAGDVAVAEEEADAKLAEQPAAESASGTASDKYAAIITKAGELMKESKYIYAAELLQMCSDRSEDKQQRKQADILIIECLALSDKGAEARSRWVEFLNKQYMLDEDDKINLKRVMSSL